MQHSEAVQQSFLKSTLLPSRLDHFTATSAQSLAVQAHAEASDELDFESFLTQWNDYRL
jgi:glutamate--cysteine ligase